MLSGVSVSLCLGVTPDLCQDVRGWHPGQRWSSLLSHIPGKLVSLLPSASVYIIQISASLDKWNTGKQNQVTDANLIPSNHFVNVRTFHLMSCFITICPNSALSASDPSIIGHWPHQCSASGHHLMNRKLFQIRQFSNSHREHQRSNSIFSELKNNEIYTTCTNILINIRVKLFQS